MRMAVLVMVVGCTSDPATGVAKITVSSGVPIASAYARRADGSVSFTVDAPGTTCAQLARAGSIDAFHADLVVQAGTVDRTYPIVPRDSMPIEPSAVVSLFDDCSNSLTCFDASAVFNAGTIEIHWGDDAATGTLTASGSSAKASDIEISGTFEAPYCP